MWWALKGQCRFDQTGEFEFGAEEGKFDFSAEGFKRAVDDVEKQEMVR